MSGTRDRTFTYNAGGDLGSKPREVSFYQGINIHWIRDLMDSIAYRPGVVAGDKVIYTSSKNIIVVNTGTRAIPMHSPIGVVPIIASDRYFGYPLETYEYQFISNSVNELIKAIISAHQIGMESVKDKSPLFEEDIAAYILQTKLSKNFLWKRCIATIKAHNVGMEEDEAVTTMVEIIKRYWLPNLVKDPIATGFGELNVIKSAAAVEARLALNSKLNSYDSGKAAVETSDFRKSIVIFDQFMTVITNYANLLSRLDLCRIGRIQSASEAEIQPRNEMTISLQPDF